MRHLDASLEGFLPYLDELFGLPVEDELLTQLHPHLKQWKTFEGLRALTVAGSQRRHTSS